MVTLLLLCALWFASASYLLWRDYLHYLPLDFRMRKVSK